jgi:hypothetical protein
MPRQLARSYQRHMRRCLVDIFQPEPVVSEWSSFTLVDMSYAPRLDIAVGPFATDTFRFEETYDLLTDRHAALLRRLREAHQVNMRAYGISQDDRAAFTPGSLNHNARCFLAIEIENKVSRKHLLGGAFNAAALGRFGIVVGFTPDKVKALARLRGYLDFLARVGKPTINVSHLFVLSRSQFSECLRHV